MYTILLRAYFDLYGNFDNVVNVPFYDILNKAAKQKDLTVEEFETMLNAYFVIDKKEIVGPMIQYFLVSKK